MARHFKPEDKALTDSIREGQGKIFAEDLDVLERQQANLLAFPDYQLLKLDIDAGGVQSRRVITRIINEERAQQEQTQSDNVQHKVTGDRSAPLQEVSF